MVALSPWAGEALKASANVLLPMAPFTETSGTFVNAEGRWQSFAGAATPSPASRPGWKVLRVLGNRLGLDGFDYTSSEEVRDELRRRLDGAALPDRRGSGPVAATPAGRQELERIGDVAIHGADALVRRAAALQKTPDALAAAVARLCAAQAARSWRERRRLRRGSRRAGRAITVPLVIDERVPLGVPLAARGHAGQRRVSGASYGPIGVTRVLADFGTRRQTHNADMIAFWEDHQAIPALRSCSRSSRSCCR